MDFANGWWAVTGSWKIGFGGRSKMGQPRRSYSEDYRPATIRLITEKSGSANVAVFAIEQCG